MSSDSFAIANLVHKYARAYDEGDLQALGDCFVSDASFSWQITDNASGGPYHGRDNIVTLQADIKASQNDRRRHVISNLTIDGIGDERSVESYLTLYAVRDGALAALTTGVYTDRVVRVENGQWRFASRDLICDLPF